MATTCSAKGCRSPVPAELELARLCVTCFTLRLEEACRELRRECGGGTPARERRGEIAQYIAENGEKLARVATGGVPLADSVKSRILSTFLTLMNLRESLDRAAAREPLARKVPSSS